MMLVGIGNGQVGARNAPARLKQNIGQGVHARAGDADQMGLPRREAGRRCLTPCLSGRLPATEKGRGPGGAAILDGIADRWIHHGLSYPQCGKG